MAVTPSTLEGLPQDILDLVFKESHIQCSPAQYRDLRLLSKSLKNFVEPQAFSGVSIAFCAANMAVIGAKLSWIASGASPYTRWARTLVIGDLIPVKPVAPNEYAYEPFEAEDRQRMLEYQTRWLIPAIEALKNVQTASFRSSRRYPFEEVIKSLSGLSSLEDLSLVSIDLETPELAGFSNLKALRLAYPVTTASEGLHGIFARSATLTVLDIDMPPVEKDDGTTGLHDLSTLIPESVSRRQSAHLKDLRVGRHVMLSAKCIPSLQSLTTLKLDWNSATPPAAFWKSLEVAGIYLRTLHVSKFERCIAHYTLSYSGLEELDLAWVGQRMEEDLVLEDEISNHFYHSVVPKHAGSLKTLQIKGTCVGPWCVTQSNMKAITKCSGLRRLAILYFFPRDAGSVSSQSFSMSDLFRTLAKELPGLHELLLQPTREHPKRFGCGFAAGNYHRAFNREFVDTFKLVEFAATGGPPSFCVLPHFWAVDGSVQGTYRWEEIKKSPQAL